jgi:membrane protease YdiL (CAAX protease family)
VIEDVADQDPEKGAEAVADPVAKPVTAQDAEPASDGHAVDGQARDPERKHSHSPRLLDEAHIHGANPELAGEPGPEKHWLKPPVTTEVALVATVLLLLLVNYTTHRVAWIENLPELVIALLFVGALSAIAWWSGHGLEEVGLARNTWRAGLVWSALLITVVGSLYMVAGILPMTRGLFTDDRYSSLTFTEVLVRAFIIVPFATVLPEELAFRGVLFGLALRKWAIGPATAFSATLFGLWHVLTSLHLDSQKPALTSLLGRSAWGAVLADLGAVVFTGLSGAVFCELRRRSRSLLVPMSLHWATNALGYLVGFLVRVHGL